jgi:cytochrome c peroxidase
VSGRWRRGSLRALGTTWLWLGALTAVEASTPDAAARAWGHPFWGGLGTNGTPCVACHQADPYAVLEDASPVLASQWWVAGGSRRVPAYAWYKTPGGAAALLNAEGPVDTERHPFFAPMGTNGRACVTCHQPADGMSLSVQTIQSRWTTTAGHDPLFAMIDGANCPGLPAAQRASHSLLLTKGLFRVSLPWPPRDAAGRPQTAEFALELIDDPTGCNRDSRYGMSAPEPMVSVFRRPRMAANLRYLEPADGHATTALMSDGRAAHLTAQMDDATVHHLESGQGLTDAAQHVVRAFERQVYAAAAWHPVGGLLNEGGSRLGVTQLAAEAPSDAAHATADPFPEVSAWLTRRSLAEGLGAWPADLPAPPPHRPGEAEEAPAVRAYRDSVARGYALFVARPFRGTDGRTQTCATCHNARHTGSDALGGHGGLGVAALVEGLPAADLPLFRATCRDGLEAPWAGRVVYTHDPGRALVTGRCADLGEVNAQQLRALAARAPYFTGGSAATLREVVEYYDRRFAMGYTPADVADMVHFLEAL